MRYLEKSAQKIFVPPIKSSAPDAPTIDPVYHRIPSLSTHSRQPGARALSWLFLAERNSAGGAVALTSGARIGPKNRTAFLREVLLRIVFDPDKNPISF
jgi:hypothetical protein